jgi:hypothetical protein
MAFSEEASLKPLIARALNSISFGWHWPKSFRDFLASSVAVISTSGSTSPKVSRRIVGNPTYQGLGIGRVTGHLAYQDFTCTISAFIRT